MNFDADKVDDYTLALMYLVMHQRRGITRAWKGFDWGTTDRLYEKGYISDPKGKAKSVVMTEEGARRAEELFFEFFGVDENEDAGSDGDADDAHAEPTQEPIDPLDDPQFQPWWDPEELQPVEVNSSDLIYLESALTDHTYNQQTYLDTETGEVHLFSSDFMFDIDNPPSKSAPDWQLEAFETYRDIEADREGRYISPSRIDSHEAWQDMRDFVDTVTDPEFRQQLDDAIRGRGAFGRFRRTVRQREEVADRWFEFSSARTRWRLKAWLADEGYRLVVAEDED